MQPITMIKISTIDYRHLQFANQITFHNMQITKIRKIKIERKTENKINKQTQIDTQANDIQDSNGENEYKFIFIV